MKVHMVAVLLLSLPLLVSSIQNTKENALEPSFDENIIRISLKNCTEGEAVKQRETFLSASNIIINVTDVPSDMSFLILQVHTYQYNVTLSYDKLHLTKVSNRSLFGSNIGLYVVPNKINTTQVFLRNVNVRTVEALVAVVPYTNKAPIPGGCNMEFNIEEAPYQKLVVNDAFVAVDSQPASLPPMLQNERNCEKNPVQLDAYRFYLNEKDYSMESYFEAITKMLTVQDIMRNGVKIPPPVSSSSFRRIYSNYPGVGSVYAAVATYGSRTAAYVPTFTYGCNYALYPEGCSYLNDVATNIVCGLVFFAAILCILLGHRFPQGELFVINTVFCITVGYIVVSSFSHLSVASNIGISLGVGLIFMIVLIIFSVCTGVNGSAVVALTSCGFLCSSIVYFSAADSTGIWENNWTFWSIYLSIALVFIIILSVSSCISVGPLNAILCSYLVILSVDYFAGSSLKYIVINVIRRLIVPEFNQAVISPPIQSRDSSLIAFWIILFILRITNEFCGNIFCFFCQRNNACGCVNVPGGPESPLLNRGHNVRIIAVNRWRSYV